MIRWNDNTLTEDEKFGPTTEDMILIVVLGLLDQRLPAHVKSHYALKMEDRWLMDFKTDIFSNFSKFIEEIEGLEQLNALRADSPSLAATNSYNRSRSQTAEVSPTMEVSSIAESATTARRPRQSSSPT